MEDNHVADRTRADPEEMDPINHSEVSPFVFDARPGKTCARDSLQDWPDEGSDEVPGLNPHYYAYPLPSTSADPAQQDLDAP